MTAVLDIRATTRGTKDIERRLGKMLDGVSNLEPLMDEIGGIMVASTQDNFENSRGPDGTAWTPSKRAKKENGKTLIDSGILFGSQTHNATNNSVEWGSNMIYAGIQNDGGNAGRGGATKLPARTYLGINVSDEIAIEAAATDYLGGLLQ